MIRVAHACGFLRRIGNRCYTLRSRHVAITKSSSSSSSHTDPELTILRSQKPLRQAVAGLGSIVQTDRSRIRNIDLSPDLNSDLKLLFIELIKINNWFRGVLDSEISVRIVSSHVKKVLKVEFYLPRLYFAQNMLTKETRNKTNGLVHRIVKQIFDANIDFGFDVPKFFLPQIRCKPNQTGSGGRIIITTRLETVELESMKVLEIQTAKKIADFFSSRQISKIDDQVESRVVWYDELYNENTRVYQKILFADKFLLDIFGKIEKSLKKRALLGFAKSGGTSSAEICFANNKLYFVIDANLKLKWCDRNNDLRMWLDMQAYKLASELIPVILDKLGDPGIKFNNVITACAYVGADRKISIEANVEIQFVKEHIKPTQTQVVKREFHSKALKLKKVLDLKASNQKHKGFKFLNYDKLQKIGVGEYESKIIKNDVRMLLLKHALRGKFMPVDGLPSLQVATMAGKNFKNPTNREVIEQLGFLVTRELMFYLTAIPVERKLRSVTELLNVFFSKLNDIKLIESNREEDIELRSIESINAYIGLSYLEQKNMDLITQWCKNTLRTQKLTFLYDRDVFMANWMPTIKAIEDRSPFDFSLFLQLNRPVFLHSSLPRLPALPKLKNQFLYSFLRLCVLENLVHGNACTFLRYQLDDLGDAILKKYSAEYFIQLEQIEPQFVWNMDDIHFINSNILFSKLAISYKLHRAIQCEKHANGLRTRLEGSFDRANVLLGDMFERLVAIEYLDDPDKCRKWVFAIYDSIRLSLTAEHKPIKFLDKEKYLETLKYLLQTSSLY